MDKMREKFEKWASENFLQPESWGDTVYRHDYTQTAWQAWKAATKEVEKYRAVLETALGYFHMESEDTMADMEWEKTEFVSGYTGEPIYQMMLRESQLILIQRMIEQALQK